MLVNIWPSNYINIELHCKYTQLPPTMVLITMSGLFNPLEMRSVTNSAVICSSPINYYQ